MRHDRPHERFALVVRRHRNNAAKDFERPAVPVFNDIVLGSETGVDERAQIPADLLAAIPFCNTGPAYSIFSKAVETRPQVLSSISFQKRAATREAVCTSISIWDNSDLEAITPEVIDKGSLFEKLFVAGWYSSPPIRLSSGKEWSMSGLPC